MDMTGKIVIIVVVAGAAALLAGHLYASHKEAELAELQAKIEKWTKECRADRSTHGAHGYACSSFAYAVFESVAGSFKELLHEDGRIAAVNAVKWCRPEVERKRREEQSALKELDEFVPGRDRFGRSRDDLFNAWHERSSALNEAKGGCAEIERWAKHNGWID